MDNPKRLDEIIAQVKRMDTIDVGFYQIAADNTMHNFAFPARGDRSGEIGTKRKALISKEISAF